MGKTPFILLLFGLAIVWLGLTGRLGAVLAAIFEPTKLQPLSGSSLGKKPAYSELPGSGGKIYIPNDPYSNLGGGFVQ